MKKLLIATGVLCTLSLPVAAGDEVAQIAALEARIDALAATAETARQQAAEALAALAATRAEITELRQQVTEPSMPAPVTATTSTEVAGNAFNPAISLILAGQYTQHSLDGDYLRAGFPLAGEAGPSTPGLSLGESEFTLSSNIDDKFYGQLTVALESEDGADELGIEEAYIETTALPGALTLRAGRFFSNIGYLNNHHAHTDKFVDRPLAYEALLGNQYADDGLQLRYVAPTEIFLELGGEVLRGQNYPSGGAAHDGVGVTSLFAHLGGDIGSESSWLAGVSMLRARTEGGEDGFSGDNTLYIADATWKWAPGGNTKDGGITLRGEYLLDDRDGEVVNPDDASLLQDWNGQRRGAYLEGVYRINRHWEAGYRHDRLWAAGSGPYASDYDPTRNSLMLAWLNSEFSLLRLQVSEDQPNSTDTDHVLSLQYQTALGAHGAHKF